VTEFNDTVDIDTDGSGSNGSNGSNVSQSQSQSQSQTKSDSQSESERRASFQEKRSSFSAVRRRKSSASLLEFKKLALDDLEKEKAKLSGKEIDQNTDNDETQVGLTDAELGAESVVEHGGDDEEDEDDEEKEDKKVLELWKPWQCDFCQHTIDFKLNFCQCASCDGVYHVRPGGYSGPIAMSDETLGAIDLGVFERVIESMIERHKGQANVANMTIAQIEHAKAALAEGLAGEVVQYVSNIRPRLKDDAKAEVMELFLYVVVDQLDEQFEGLEQKHRDEADRRRRGL